MLVSFNSFFYFATFEGILYNYKTVLTVKD